LGYDRFYILFPAQNKKYFFMKNICSADQIKPYNFDREYEIIEEEKNQIDNFLKDQNIFDYNPFDISTKFNFRINELMKSTKISKKNSKRKIDKQVSLLNNKKFKS
jgi:hypothetical protein